MLMPKRTKHKKMFRGRLKGTAQKGNTVAFGDYGLQSLEPSWITNRQIESCRVAMNRTFKREGKIFIRIFPDKPITKRPIGVRMGKGKGNVEGWVAVVKPGRILFEVAGVTEEKALAALRKATMKLPINCKVVKRENGGEN
ncbi:MAG: 50S ribosomal protein L16 [Fusobacteriaceae bacterium]